MSIFVKQSEIYLCTFKIRFTGGSFKAYKEFTNI